MLSRREALAAGIEKTIDNIHEMVNQYGGEGDFEAWCELRAYLRQLQVNNAALEGRLRKAEELAKYVSEVVQCDEQKNCKCIGCEANSFLAELSPSES